METETISTEGMEQEEAKKPRGKKKQEEATLDKIVGILGDMAKRIEDLEKRESSVSEKCAVPTEKVGDGVSEEIVGAVHSELNNEFGVEVEASRNFPSFTCSIIVPRVYSNEKPAYLDFYKKDVRSRVISNAEGVNGVKAWAQRVFQNLPSETRAAIVAHRGK